MKKGGFTTVLLVAVFFIGLSLVLYPTVSDYWNSKVQSRAVDDYAHAVNQPGRDYSAEFAAADQYNAAVAQLDYPFTGYEAVPGYADLLDVMGTGVMGYVTIDKIKVELSIYHGTGIEALSQAAGHLEGSSLPVGGPSTHAVISAHRGLPSARLFTNLDKLEVGDVFSVTVLDRQLVYQVDQILIVEPNDVSPLYVEEGRDLCTLVTCTPYGINTHRLLVRGTRIDAPEEKNIYVTTEAYRIDSLVLAPVVAAPMLLVLLVALLVRHRNKDSEQGDRKEP